MKTVLELRSAQMDVWVSGRESDGQVHGHELSALRHFKMVAITTINIFKQFQSKWTALLPVRYTDEARIFLYARTSSCT
jgi:hypothetical protein